MCDSLGDSNQAGVHFLGIGSQLRGPDVPRVIKRSQPVIDCTSVVTTNIPGQKKKPKPLASSKGDSPGDFAPLRTIYGADGMSGTCTQTWVTEQLVSAMLHASRGNDAICIAGVSHQNKHFAKLRNPWT